MREMIPCAFLEAVEGAKFQGLWWIFADVLSLRGISIKFLLLISFYLTEPG